MNQTDLQLIHRLVPQHTELSRLYDEHVGYEERLQAMARHKWQSPADYTEEQRLKRLKLAGRDRIAEILVQARRHAPSAL